MINESTFRLVSWSKYYLRKTNGWKTGKKKSHQTVNRYHHTLIVVKSSTNIIGHCSIIEARNLLEKHKTKQCKRKSLSKETSYNEHNEGLETNDICHSWKPDEP